MNYILFSVSLFAIFTTTYACKGCLSLDEYNFGKVITKFKAVLVKFDIAYPYGDKHEVFTKFAEEVVSNKDFVLAEVGIKDYGERENEALAKEYGIKGKDDLPVVKLFLGSTTKNIHDFTATEFTVNNLRNFVRDNADMYIGLPGCLEEFDILASEFTTSPDKEKKLKEIEEIAEKHTEPEKSVIKTYLTFMKKIIESGMKFVTQEKSRLNKILKDGKLANKKKEELSQRLNILHSFRMNKDEL
ncbi:endoplasmic reticulum protein erp29 [Holotrichia oblita]|uniref:Endoplasmic reticulum protein erp29 n=1 Tax=Holotrichia oblita TaxID=644536 RepID=A0ACB9SII2_HOLOL|nr:endoplasmic reticulum protein erp29 [Holotrichia oblita]